MKESLFRRKRTILPILLILCLGVTLFLLLAVLIISNKKVEALKRQNNELTAKLNLIESNQEASEKKPELYQSCTGTDYCNIIAESRRSFVAVYTSRLMENTFNVSLPSGWIISSYGGNEYSVSVGTATKPVVANIYTYAGKTPNSVCLQNPELQSDLTDEEKRLYRKYNSFKTNFGTLKLSNTTEGYNSNQRSDPKFKICQTLYEGYPVFVTDTSIGVIDVYSNDSEEIDTLIGLLKNAKVTKQVLKL